MSYVESPARRARDPSLLLLLLVHFFRYSRSNDVLLPPKQAGGLTRSRLLDF